MFSWDHISSPKSSGGWGVQKLFWVYKALHAKSLWRGLMDEGLWGSIMQDKYIYPDSVNNWICDGIRKKYCSSVT